jgi:tRNA pseudouridine55 synthase
VDGVLVVDKPEGWTSHDAVDKVRRLVNTRRVGHLGTLDPIATGVLPLVVGKVTRLAQFYMRGEKRYDAVVHIGYSTVTYDRAGTPTSPVTEPAVDRRQLEEVLERFRGVFEQMPPPISAKKIGGKPAYRLARKNLPVELRPVEVTVHSIELVNVEGPEARIVVRCTAGTYMRSIAHDLGKAVGCGGFLQSLCRTASGEFTLEQARTVEELEKLAAENRLDEVLIPAARLLPDFPSELVDPLTAGQIRQGRDFRVSPFRAHAGVRYVKAVTQDGKLVAIGEVKLPNVYHPFLVL